MSRRRSHLSDPTPQWAVYEDDLLQKILDSLSPREAAVLKDRYGITDGQPKTLGELGKKYMVSRERIRQVEQTALARFLHPSRSEVLVVRDGGIVCDLIDLRKRIDRIPTDEQMGIIRCGFCRRRFVPQNYAPHVGAPWNVALSGRPRKYCSNRCRQAAYRVRKAQKGQAARTVAVKSAKPEE